jgi:cytochrome c-type biogenesis protein CcmE
MSPVARNRLIALGALLVAGAGLAFVAFGNIGENLVYYWSPAEMITQGEKAYGPTIRLGGVVKPGSIQWNAEHTTLHFQVATDHKPESLAVTVRSTEVPPQMFRDGIGVVVEGTYDKSQVFASNRLMVNHSNEYRAPKEGEEPRKWQETVEGSTTAANTAGAK